MHNDDTQDETLQGRDPDFDDFQRHNRNADMADAMAYAFASPLTSKDTNPKDAVGTKKWRQYCTVPATVIAEVGVAMLEGAMKYGRHNYRVAGVQTSIYVDAAKGHIDSFWEGEDVDEDSGLSHVVKAIASLVVLRDAMIQKKLNDDRPPKANLDAVRDDLQRVVESLFDKYPEPKQAYTEMQQRVHFDLGGDMLHDGNPLFDAELRILTGIEDPHIGKFPADLPTQRRRPLYAGPGEVMTLGLYPIEWDILEKVAAFVDLNSENQAITFIPNVLHYLKTEGFIHGGYHGGWLATTKGNHHITIKEAINVPFKTDCNVASSQ